MTPNDEAPTALPDLRAVRLEEMPGRPAAVLGQLVQRVLSGSSTVPAPGTAFGPSI